MAHPHARTESLEAALPDRYWERLRVFGMRRLGDAALAEDLAQEVLGRVTEALREGRVDDLDALPGFVFQTATHLCLHHYRDRGREDLALSRLAREPDAQRPNPLDSLLSDEARQAVREALDRLDREDRDLLHSVYFLEQSTEEVAAQLGITPGALRVRKHRAQERLSRFLLGWRL